MVELGKYAGAILSSWGITLGALALLIVLSWVQSVRAKRALDLAEARRAARRTSDGDTE